MPTETGPPYICSWEQFMGNRKYLLSPEFNGVHKPFLPTINPHEQGVTFASTTPASVLLYLAPSSTLAIKSLSIANKTITNVDYLNVTIIAENGDIIKILQSPVNSTRITGFPTPLPVNSALLINFATSNKEPAHNVTLSILGCFYSKQPTTIGTSVSTTTVHSTSQSEYDILENINDLLVVVVVFL